MTDKFRVGVISSVHGVHGEAKVFVTSDDPKRFRDLKTVIAVGLHGSKVLELESVKFHKDMAICKFKGIDTPEEIRMYRGMDLMIDRKDAVPLKKDEHYIADLIGLDVVTDEGSPIGKVSDLYPTGANSVLVVKTPEGTEILLPYIDEFVRSIDTEEGKVTVHLMDGII